MPKITKVFELEVTPEHFLNACSPEELIEVELLITSPRFVNKMNEQNSKSKKLNEG